MELEVKNDIIRIGKNKSVRLEIETIFWATGKATYHIYATTSTKRKIKVFKDYVENNSEIKDFCGHLIITDNV